MAAAHLRRCFFFFFVQLLSCQLCVICGQEGPGSIPNQNKQTLDGATRAPQGVPGIDACKGSDSVSHNSNGLFMNPRAVYSSGLTNQTIRLVSVSSSDFGQCESRLGELLLILHAAWV